MKLFYVDTKSWKNLLEIIFTLGVPTFLSMVLKKIAC
jgi:hypothetical protein